MPFSVPLLLEKGNDMSLKLKILGMGLLAVMATSAFAAMNASATVGGHFINDAPNGHAIITGTEVAGTLHIVRLQKEGGSAEETTQCHSSSYTGTVNAATVQSVTITPNWSSCTTGGSGGTSFEVHENGCSLTFTSGKTGQTHHTVDVVCPVGKSIEMTHPNCTTIFPAQTVRGVTYPTTVENNKHALTMNVTVGSITSHYETGICIFLGTTHKWEMKGSVTVKATNTEGNPVNITETTGL
jgi:hypothetical protein